MSLQHGYSLHPITALAFAEAAAPEPHGLLLAGEGRWLKLLDAENAQVLGQRQIFAEQAIHGVATCRGSDAAVVWGSSCLAFLSDARSLLQRGDEAAPDDVMQTQAPDWIMDVALAPARPSACALITAHNALFLAEPAAGRVAVRALGSSSRSILYSAHLLWEAPDRILVAAGTVFGEIMVWRCELDDAATTNTLLATFTGHEGSIFGVQISPPIPAADGASRRLLASCSDDRTVRVWDILDASAGKQPHDDSAPRETGFGEHGDRQSGCLAVAMGHASRIWRVKFMLAADTTTNVLSFGEDATCQQWVLVDTPGQPTDLVHAKTFPFHTGKHIWSAAVREESSNASYVATGGADGAVMKYHLPMLGLGEYRDIEDLSSRAEADLEKKQEVAETWSLEDIIKLAEAEAGESSTVVGDASKKTPKDIPNRYAFVSKDKLLVTSNAGRIFLATIGSSVRWREHFLPEAQSESLRSYAAMAGIPQLGLAFMAGRDGILYSCTANEKLSIVGQLNGKVASITALPVSTKESVSLLATVLETKEAHLLEIDTQTLKITSDVLLEVPSVFVITAAARSRDLLILGARSGYMAVFDLAADSKPVDMFPPLKSEVSLAITSIIEVPFTGDTNESIILTTTRKGSYHIYRLAASRSDGGLVVSRTHSHTSHPPFGPMIEAAWFSEQNELFLYGFRSKSFVVWNETKQCEVGAVDCGGAHRSFAYTPWSSSGAGVFAYTKSSQIYLHLRRQPTHSVVQAGGHGREIKACAVSPDGRLLATASEDTRIRIWASSAGRMECLAVLPLHTAGPQQLRFFEVRTAADRMQLLLFSSAGNEEFFVWSITSIPGFGIGVRCIGVCDPPDPDVRDLRIMAFDMLEVDRGTGADGDVLQVTLALSDSTMRIYHWSASSFSPVGDGRYTAHCLTQLRYLPVAARRATADASTLPLVLTAATDGFLALHKFCATTSGLPLRLAVAHRFPLHQNSIKTLALLPAPPVTPSNAPGSSADDFAVITGGDDGAVAVSRLSLGAPRRCGDGDEASTSAPTIATCIVRTGHAAAVTALTAWQTSKGGLRVASASNDQRVKLWEVALAGGTTPRVQQAADEFTAIADVGDVVCVPSQTAEAAETTVLVVGVGMEEWVVQE